MLKLIIIALAAACLYYYALPTFEEFRPGGPEPQACTTEAKLCPDGSTVGRQGSNCEFVACPGI